MTQRQLSMALGVALAAICALAIFYTTMSSPVCPGGTVAIMDYSRRVVCVRGVEAK